MARCPLKPPRVAVKEAVFPFARFAGVDPVLGAEMRSTGEVMGVDESFGAAFLKSQIAAGASLPDGGVCFISVKSSDKSLVTPIARDLTALGFKLIATRGTAAHLVEQGVDVEVINKVLEGRPRIGCMVDHLIAVDEVEEFVGKRQLGHIGLNEVDTRVIDLTSGDHQRLTSRVDTIYRCGRVLGEVRGVPPRPGAGVQNEGLPFQNALQPGRIEETIPLKVPVSVETARVLAVVFVLGPFLPE